VGVTRVVQRLTESPERKTRLDATVGDILRVMGAIRNLFMGNQGDAMHRVDLLGGSKQKLAKKAEGRRRRSNYLILLRGNGSRILKRCRSLEGGSWLGDLT